MVLETFLPFIKVNDILLITTKIISQHNMFCFFCPLDFQDNCEDSPCGDGSRCLDSYFTYYCDCKQGFIGDHCEIGRMC